MALSFISRLHARSDNLVRLTIDLRFKVLADTSAMELEEGFLGLACELSLPLWRVQETDKPDT